MSGRLHAQGEMLRVDDVVGRLAQLGLAEEEAGVFVHLSILGASKASRIADATGLNRPKTYRTLKSLVDQGFVTETLERPTRFVAVAPDALFEALLARQRAHLQTIVEARDEVGPALEALAAATNGDPAASRFRTVHGRRAIYDVMEQMVRGATDRIEAVTTHEAAPRMTEVAGVQAVTLERAREGVQVHAVLRDTSRVREALAGLPRIEGLEHRLLATDRLLRFVLVDRRELLLWMVSDRSHRLGSDIDVAIWSDAEDLVTTQVTLFETLWERAKDAPP